MSFSILRRTHDAISTNPSSADKSLTSGASSWLWAVFALFLVTLLSWLVWSFILKEAGHGHSRGKKHGNKTTADTTTATAVSTGLSPDRIFHYLWTVAAFAGMVAYFTMASNLGNTAVRQYLRHGNNVFQTREVFYARYIYWFIAWPMVVIATLLLSGVGWATILFAVAFQELWVVSWLCGALVHTKYKWGFYVFGILAYLVLAAVLLTWGRTHSVRLSSKHYTPLAGALVFFWAIYMIAWGLSEGGNYLSITGEHIFYGLLDLITVPLLGFAFLALSRKWDHHALGLHYTQGRVAHHDGLAHGMTYAGAEKTHHAHGHDGVHHDGVVGHEGTHLPTATHGAHGTHGTTATHPVVGTQSAV